MVQNFKTVWINRSCGLTLFQDFVLFSNFKIGWSIWPRVIKTICTTQDMLLTLVINQKWKQLGCYLLERENIWTGGHMILSKADKLSKYVAWYLLYHFQLEWIHFFLIGLIPWFLQTINAIKFPLGNDRKAKW